MKMRKVWAMLTAGAMCFGLMAGCSNDAGTDSQAPDDGDTQQSQPAGDEQSQAPRSPWTRSTLWAAISSSS